MYPCVCPVITRVFNLFHPMCRIWCETSHGPQAARDSTPSANASTPGGAFGRDGSQRQIPMGLVIDSMGLVWIIFYLELFRRSLWIKGFRETDGLHWWINGIGILSDRLLIKQGWRSLRWWSVLFLWCHRYTPGPKQTYSSPVKTIYTILYMRYIGIPLDPLGDSPTNHGI